MVRSPEAITSLRWVKVMRWLQKVPVTRFVLVVLIKWDTHCSVDAWLIVCQNSADNNCLCLSCTLKVNGLLTHFGLEISFQEWFSTIKYQKWRVFKLLCNFPRDAIPFSSYVVQERTVPDPFLSKFTETPMALLELLCIFGNLCCVFETSLLIAWFLYSMSLNMDIKMIRHVQSHGSVDTKKRAEFSLLIWIVVWPENVCQWNCTGLTVISFLSMNVDESDISECCRQCLIRTDNTDSENTLTSVLNHCPTGCSNREKNLLEDAVSQFCLSEIPQNFQGIIFEVFKPGSHSFIGCLCFGN